MRVTCLVHNSYLPQGPQQLVNTIKTIKCKTKHCVKHIVPF